VVQEPIHAESHLVAHRVGYAGPDPAALEPGGMLVVGLMLVRE
jgi:hypothetical protein